TWFTAEAAEIADNGRSNNCSDGRSLPGNIQAPDCGGDFVFLRKGKHGSVQRSIKREAGHRRLNVIPTIINQIENSGQFTAANRPTERFELTFASKQKLSEFRRINSQFANPTIIERILNVFVLTKVSFKVEPPRINADRQLNRWKRFLECGRRA